MQENEVYIVDPSQSVQGDSPSVFLHSSKLQKRLEKLAQWRIDPSLIELPADAREFRGGFATVSQGFFASSSRAKGGANESKHLTDEHQNLVDVDSQPNKDLQQSEPQTEEKNKEADSRKADGDNGRPEEEGTKEPNDEEHRSPRQPAIPDISNEASVSHRIVNEGPDLDDRDHQSHRNTEGVENGQQDEKTSKVVAVKKLKIERDTDFKRVLGLALREAEFLVRLSHPNIVKLEGFVEEPTECTIWLIFPWEEHGNLRDFLASGEWEIPERISLIDDVTQGLEYLHGQEPPIYHGDLKSLNILVNSKCYALITDFGSARHLENDDVGKRTKDKEGLDNPRPATSDSTTIDEHITLEAIFSATASTLTLTGSGYTLRWAAPELLQDDKPCLRSDIWAFGWIAYEVMTNTIPFHDIKKDSIVISRVIQGQLPPVTEDARMSLIRALCSLMLQCWSINPDKRPTAGECRKSISWMPMIAPASTPPIDEVASQLRHAQLMNKLGVMYGRQSDYVSALSCFTDALNIYTTQSNMRGRAGMLRHLADVHRIRSEHAEAITFYREAMQIYAALGDESERADAIFGLAMTHLRRQEYGEATKLYSESLQSYTNSGSQREKATALWGLAEVHRLQAEHSEAIELYSKALQIYTDVGDRRRRALTLWGLAEVHRLQDEYTEAIKLYSEALQIYTDLGDRRETALTLWGLAEVHRFQGEYTETIKLYSEALQIYTDIGDHRERARILWGLAEVHRLRNEYSQASKLHSEALQIRTEIGDRLGRGTALWGLAEVHREIHEYNEAAALYSQANQIFIDLGDKYWRVETLMSLAAINQICGHSGEAIAFYTEASEVLEELGDSSRASEALGSAADIRKTLEGATVNSAETVKVGEESLLT